MTQQQPQPYEPTISYLFEMPEPLQQRLFAHMRRNPDQDGDAILCCALDRYLCLEEIPQVEHCAYCHSASLLVIRANLTCGYCGLVQPTEPDCVVIPQGLLSDLIKAVGWGKAALQSWTKYAAGEQQKDLETLAEQCAQIESWAAEYAPKTSP